MKRGYLVYEYEGDDGCLGCVAETAHHAKKMCWGDTFFNNDSWINMHVEWRKEANVDNLPIGKVDLVDGLKCGIFDYIEGDVRCPMCGDFNRLYYENEMIGCRECLDEQACFEYACTDVSDMMEDSDNGRTE